MKHLNRIPSQFSISIPPDENGLIGRECPEPNCESYFKIQPGTGLKGEDLPCHCPDCGVHNSLQILGKNFDLIEKLLTIAETQETSVSQQLIENALEDCVSAFDGFGRETCRVFAEKAASPKKAAEIRFQNIKGAAERVLEEFDVTFSDVVEPADWVKTQQAFEKRHLLAHKMGVADEAYQKATGASGSVIGRRVSITRDDIHELLLGLRAIGSKLYATLEAKS